MSRQKWGVCGPEGPYYNPKSDIIDVVYNKTEYSPVQYHCKVNYITILQQVYYF